MDNKTNEPQASGTETSTASPPVTDAQSVSDMKDMKLVVMGRFWSYLRMMSRSILNSSRCASLE